MAVRWPCDVLRPKNVAFDIAPRTLAAPASISGVTQVVATDAGIWKATYGDIGVRKRDQVLMFRAISTLLEGRLGSILVPLCYAYQPKVDLDPGEVPLYWCGAAQRRCVLRRWQRLYRHDQFGCACRRSSCPRHLRQHRHRFWRHDRAGPAFLDRRTALSGADRHLYDATAPRRSPSGRRCARQPRPAPWSTSTIPFA